MTSLDVTLRKARIMARTTDRPAVRVEMTDLRARMAEIVRLTRAPFTTELERAGLVEEYQLLDRALWRIQNPFAGFETAPNERRQLKEWVAP